MRALLIRWKYLFLAAAVLLLGLAFLFFLWGGPVGSAPAEKLSQWIASQPYSVWFTFRNRGEEPERPASPDGLTLGSPNVFAAIGCNPDDLSELTTMWGDNRTARAFGKPLTLSAMIDDAADKPLAQFVHQTLRRVRRTSISVSAAEEGGLRITTIDFAPMEQADNFLVRWFLVENGSTGAHRVTLSLHLTGGGEWKKHSAHAFQWGEKLAFVSDQNLDADEEALAIPLGRLRSGQRASAAVFVILAQNNDSLAKSMACADAARSDPFVLLNNTKTEWVEWREKTPLITNDERVDDLLDSLLCLVRSHVGTNALHTGSVRYPHDRAWVRDNYWVQRALFELGLTQEAKVGLDFFHRAWHDGGIASSYQTRDGKPMSYGYARVELPHYLVLMVRDAEQFGRVNAKEYWDMVHGCLDRAAFPENGLQPMNGDETWLLAAPVRELDDLIDNSWLLIASAEFGSKLAQRMGDWDRAATYGSMAYKARMALRDYMPPDTGGVDWLATGRGGDGSLDYALCPEVYARGAIFDILPATNNYLSAGLVTSWERLKFDRGIRTHSRSATINGGTPGYVLYAMSQNPGCDALFRNELIARVMNFASATGCVWEYHDLYDPAWGGEKRRAWDSAVLLLGLTHALFDIQQGAEHTFFVPRPEPLALSLPPEETPGYDPNVLLESGGGLEILDQSSPEHAARLARELLCHCNRQFPVRQYLDAPPEDRPTIVISPADPPVGWLQNTMGYYVRAWGGPPQLWVKNMGHVFVDTEPLLLDLLSYLPPQHETALPFPDTNYDLAARFGEAPSGQAVIEGYWSGPPVTQTLDLAGNTANLELGQAKAQFSAFRDGEKRGILKLAFSASRPEPAEVSITLPAGWWVLYARDMTGTWDRVQDPVHEEYLPDGRIRLTYSLRAGAEPLNITFDLARLAVKTQ